MENPSILKKYLRTQTNVLFLAVQIISLSIINIITYVLNVKLAWNMIDYRCCIQIYQTITIKNDIGTLLVKVNNAIRFIQPENIKAQVHCLFCTEQNRC